MSSLPTLAAAFLGAGIATGATAAFASDLDCAVPSASRGVDASLARALRGAERHPGLDGDIRAAIGRMAAAGMAKGEIVDRLVEAYCPLVKSDPVLTFDQKQEAVRSFASAVTDTVFAPADAPESILLSVAIPPALSEQIQVAAAKRGLTRSEWVRDALTARLARP